jgi:type I restriction enzyme, S subunit
LKKHECIPGDVLIGTLGDPNLRACILPQHICVALNKADCIQLRPNIDMATPEYICSFLNTPAALSLASGFIHGQTRSRISMGQLRNLPILVPPLSCQKRFSEIFNKTCSLRRKREQAQTVENNLFDSLTQLAFHGELTSRAAKEILQQAAAS